MQKLYDGVLEAEISPVGPDKEGRQVSATRQDKILTTLTACPRGGGRCLTVYLARECILFQCQRLLVCRNADVALEEEHFECIELLYSRGVAEAARGGGDCKT